MKRLIIALIISNLLTLWFISVNSQLSTNNNETVMSVPLNENRLWLLVQQWRENNGYNLYLKDPEICRIAKERAIEQYKLGHLDYHKGFLDRYSSYPYVISENIVTSSGYGNEGEQAALNWWLSSPPHHAALEKPYTHACIKCSGSICVHIFTSWEK